MKLKKTFVVIAGIIFISCSSLLGYSIKELGMELILDKRKIVLETPIINKKSILYAPLRDMVAPIKASLKYSRKDDNYLLVIPRKKITCLIVPNSREFWINDIHHLLSANPFIYGNRLYVPLKDIFFFLGYSTKISDKSVEIISKIEYKPEQNKGIFIPKSDKYNLPYFDIYKEHYLSISNNQYELDELFFYKEDILYVALENILKKEKFLIKKEDNSITLSKDKKEYTFFTNSGIVLIKTKKSTSKRYLFYPTILKDNEYYFPMISFLSALDFQFHWDPEHGRFSLLNKIWDFKLAKTTKGDSFQIFSAHRIQASSPEDLKESKGFYIDFPNTVFSLQQEYFEVNKLNIESISCFQLNETSVRVNFFLKEETSITPIETTAYGAEINFYPTISKIQEKSLNNKNIILIESNGPFKYIKWTQPSRFIIDIPNTISNLPLVIRAQGKPYKHIRCSQFQEKPPYTRIVFDLKTKDIKPISIKQINNQLSIVFPVLQNKKQEVTKKKVPPKNPLREKIIAIDPGHGGIDPGAVGGKNIYEKNYTIDIANRLKKMLSNNGAFVIMLREKDFNPSLRRRANSANKNNADLLISIHINSFIKPFAQGSETYYYKPRDKLLAKYLQNEMKKELKLNSNGIKKARMYILRNVNMAAALVEPLFITNPKELSLLKQPHFRQKIAIALYNGIKKYLTH